MRGDPRREGGRRTGSSVARARSGGPPGWLSGHCPSSLREVQPEVEHSSEVDRRCSVAPPDLVAAHSSVGHPTVPSTNQPTQGPLHQGAVSSVDGLELRRLCLPPGGGEQRVVRGEPELLATACGGAALAERAVAAAVSERGVAPSG